MTDKNEKHDSAVELNVASTTAPNVLVTTALPAVSYATMAPGDVAQLVKGAGAVFKPFPDSGAEGQTNGSVVVRLTEADAPKQEFTAVHACTEVPGGVAMSGTQVMDLMKDFDDGPWLAALAETDPVKRAVLVDVIEKSALDKVVRSPGNNLQGLGRIRPPITVKITGPVHRGKTMLGLRLLKVLQEAGHTDVTFEDNETSPQVRQEITECLGVLESGSPVATHPVRIVEQRIDREWGLGYCLRHALKLLEGGSEYTASEIATFVLQTKKEFGFKE